MDNDDALLAQVLRKFLAGNDPTGYVSTCEDGELCIDAVIFNLTADEIAAVERAATTYPT